jgi:hypothetical protein
MTPLLHIQIPKRQAHCHKGKERLLPGTDYYSLLKEGDESMLRQDFCPHCWTTLAEEERQQAFSYWKSHIEEKKESIPFQTRPLRALAVLKNLLFQPDGNSAELFVLALYLAHARQLILRKEFEENGETYCLYEVVRQDEFFTIKKVALSQLEVEQLQYSLAIKLA